MAPRKSRPTDAKSSRIASALLRLCELRLTKSRPEILPRKEAPQSAHLIFDFRRLISFINLKNGMSSVKCSYRLLTGLMFV
jgi:hypothetical protein